MTSVVILLAAMRIAASVVAPILFALFIAALLTPIYRWLKRRMPVALALLIAIGVLGLVAAFLMLLIGNSIDALFVSLEGYQETLSLRQEELAAMAQEMGMASVFQLIVSALDPTTLANILAYTLSTLSVLLKNSLLILFVTVFALGEGPQFKSRMIKVFGTNHYLPNKTTTTLNMVISYFGLRAIVNLIVAVATSIMLWLFDIPYAGLWGVLIFFLSFIPYLGAFLSTIPPVILAYAQGGLGLAIVIVLLVILINSLAENLVQPLIMGKGLSISPTVVFLSCVLWMNILGGLGAFVAMPVTMAIILFMGEFEETRNVASVMGTIPESANPL